VQWLEERTARRLYATADAARWNLSPGAFRDALTASLEKAFSGREPTPREVDGYLRGLHLPDLALAAACIEGRDAAWEHLMREHRPALYRAADAMDATGRARELADALYGDLFGTSEQEGRRSLLRYFHGRSSLATWLRSVLAQRHVDAMRSARRLDPLPEELPHRSSAAGAPPPNPDRERYQSLLQRALDAAIATLGSRDRLRLACYHAQQLTLAETGRLLHEHEATVSRQLARTRRELKTMIERWLGEHGGLRAAQVTECLAIAMEDPGPLDLRSVLAPVGDRKIADPDRSNGEGP
jgi:RNA polymerase sigma factor (sigma-70 family)